ncbi:hypothetical protein GJ496_002433 [Pomphorhynchus laevis]|nr:hypothetical protein GJ496_002433 [Pomphorhynchus laevis]
MMYLASYLLTDSAGKNGVTVSDIIKIFKNAGIEDFDEDKAKEIVNKCLGKCNDEWVQEGEVSISALCKAEWLLSQAKNQQSKEDAKLERLERKRRNPPRHFFEDVKYKRQKEAIERELNDAIDHGFQLLANQKCAKAHQEKRRDCTSALRLIGIPEELDDDEDEEEEIICISQELYDKLSDQSLYSQFLKAKGQLLNNFEREFKSRLLLLNFVD